MRRLYYLAFPAVFLITAALIFQGCDEPHTKEDSMSVALSRMDAGDCAGAEQTLIAMGRENLGYDGLTLLGWAQLCQGGATLNNVFKTLLSTGSSDSDFAMVGDLANNLVPGTDAKMTKIHAAYFSFREATATNTAQIGERAVNMTLTSLIKAAMVLAKQYGDDGAVTRSDLAPVACKDDASSCVTTTNCTAGMSGGDVFEVIGAINQAATGIGNDSSLGKMKDLTSNLSSQIPGTEDPARCVIVNQMFRN